MDEAQSRRIAGLLGPTMIVMIMSEFPLVQPRFYEAQIPPVVYLSGVLMFVAGLAIVRAHNRWRASWTVLVTIAGLSVEMNHARWPPVDRNDADGVPISGRSSTGVSSLACHSGVRA